MMMKKKEYFCKKQKVLHCSRFSRDMVLKCCCCLLLFFWSFVKCIFKETLMFLSTEDQNGPISPLHDISLYVDSAKKIVNMVVEVPRWTNAKMEVKKKQFKK